MASPAWERATAIHDLPDVILSNIFALVTDTRSRNSLSLVCRKYLALERSTRSSLTLRGNVRHPELIPAGFRHVSHLDLSLISPWGTDLLAATDDPYFLAHRLREAFPLVTSLTVYARSFLTLQILVPLWPRLSRVKLIRWHQRPQSPLGADFETLFRSCASLRSLDLSNFYYYTEDLPPVLQAYPQISASLTKLDLLTVSFSEGFKSHEIRVITATCPNLREFLVACTFDPRYIGFVGDQALIDIATNCSYLTLLHLVDTSSLSNPRVNPEEDEGIASEDAGITPVALIEVFSRLSLLEELVLDVCRNVRESGCALEVLNSKCKNLRTLKLGRFYKIVTAIESQLDGLALCQGLTSLTIKNSPDLTDMGLIAIGRGCSKLVKFEIHGCSKITWMGMRTLTSLLRRTLVDVSISGCKNLGASASVRSVDPIRDRIQRLHIDCVWDGVDDDCDKREEAGWNFDLNETFEPPPSDNNVNNKFSNFYGSGLEEDSGRHKKMKYSLDLESGSSSGNGSYLEISNGNNGYYSMKCWEKLKYLSLWIGVGELLSPLPACGLEDCPNLEEIKIRVEGDCRGMQRPAVRAFGLSALAQYPSLWKMQLDCGEAIGYALTAPTGQMDLSLWERFFLNGIGDLVSLSELDYWPPQDREVNHRSVSLPAAGLLAECLTLRKLFIHGTAHEHFMNFLLRIPNLRDVQLREDYYPAPENDMSTEMRVDSCSRFEDALNRRQIED